MDAGNGLASRIAAAEAAERDLRQLFMDEMRSLRAELKGLTEQVRDTGRAVDTLLAELKLRDKEEDADAQN